MSTHNNTQRDQSTRKHLPTPSRQSGSAALSTVMAMGLAIFAVTAVNQVLITNMHELHATQDAGKLRDLRQWVRARVDCPKSVAPPQSCNNSINLLDASGNVVIRSNAPWTALGSYQLAASCAGNVITIRYARAINGTSQSNQTWQPLFPSNLPFGCHF